MDNSDLRNLDEMTPKQLEEFIREMRTTRVTKASVEGKAKKKRSTEDDGDEYTPRAKGKKKAPAPDKAPVMTPELLMKVFNCTKEQALDMIAEGV